MQFPTLHRMLHFSDMVLHDEMGQLYLNLSIRWFASSLISVFIPVYLISLGISRAGTLLALLLFADKFLAGFIMAGLASLVFAVF